MKIVIDLQGAQSESQHRGIGRYAKSMSLALAAAASDDHELWIALNDGLGQSIEALRANFEGLVPQERIVAYSLPGPAAGMQPGNAWRQRAGELLRENFLRQLDADWIWHTSLFEGWVDDAVTSAGILPTPALQAATLYDLIPLTRPEHYLGDPQLRAWYLRKVGHLHRQDLCFAISEWTRHEGSTLLGLPEERIATAVCGVEDSFRPLPHAGSEQQKQRLQLVYGIDKDFVLYVGGFDVRKNVSMLIIAYARSAPAVREHYRLVIGGRISAGELACLHALMRKNRLAPSEVIFTNQVDDAELKELYSCCSLFVFPSLHEGFGLTVLEAMACGAPVLAANATSLPEVVGRFDMLFDPENVDDLVDHMARVLNDAEVRREWSDYGKHRAQQFTWARGAEQMLAAFEKHTANTDKNGVTAPSSKVVRPRLAYVSPMPPEQSGIADYSAELLPELSRYYQIDVVIAQPHVSDAWAMANLPMRSVEWFEANVGRFDRILYQFGNSAFHQHMFDLLQRHPGTVVLHDFYLGAMSHWRSFNAGVGEDYLKRLYRSHGYRALLDEKEHGRDYTIKHYPATGEIFDAANGVLVHSTYSVDQTRHFYGEHAASWVRKVPFPKAQRDADRMAARRRLGIGEKEFIACSFGMIAPTKLNNRLLDAWLDSKLSAHADCRLVYVGENHGGDYGKALTDRMTAAGARSPIVITGFAAEEAYKDWLAAADMAIQLRTDSRGETSAAVFDCLGHGLPLIVNAHATFAELPDECLVKLPDEFSIAGLVDALQLLHASAPLRQQLGELARQEIAARHALPRVAGEYHAAIEAFAQQHPMAAELELIARIPELDAPAASAGDLHQAAQALVNNRQPMRLKQLLVDVTVVTENDLKTGIQRVTRNVARELLKCPPAGYRVELVKLVDGQYRYARAFTLGLLGLSGVTLTDEPVDLAAEEIFLGLDWVADRVPALTPLFQSWRNRGASVYFLVYDLLPVLTPHFFPKGIDDIHLAWLKSIATCADGVVCISATVAEEFRTWLSTINLPRERDLSIGFSHIGADIDSDAQAAPASTMDDQVFAKLGARPAVLMVGTVEPRKGQQFALDAFERLWARGEDVSLVLVGKQGWLMDGFIRRITAHAEFNTRLFWLSNVSDTLLKRIYAAAEVVLVASEAEGFGLPLIEAAQHGIPLIARDLPVFREIAGPHATYFQSAQADDLADSISAWLAAHAKGTAPESKGMPWLSWSQSARQLGEMLVAMDAPGWLSPWRAPRELGIGIGVDGLELISPAASRIKFIDWGDLEPWGRWALGIRPRIRMQLVHPCRDADLLLRLRADAFLDGQHPRQNFKMYANGQLLGDWFHDLAEPKVGYQQMQWTIPSAWLGRRGELELMLIQEQSITPASLGLSADTRSLGLGVHSLSLRWLDGTSECPVHAERDVGAAQ